MPDWKIRKRNRMNDRAGKAGFRLIPIKSWNSDADWERDRPGVMLRCYELFPATILRQSAVVRRLEFKHFRVTSAAPEKLTVRALLGNPPIFNNENAVHHPNR